MPQISVGSSNITTFGYSLNIDVFNRLFTFNLLPFTIGSGLSNTKVSFFVKDQDGVQLANIDFTTVGKYINPGTTTTWVLDLTSVNFAFLFQTYQVYASIQDQNGAVYQIPDIFPNVCQPTDLTDSGYVPGMFQIIPDCINSVLTVKEITALVYNNLAPFGVPTKTGVLSYPTGTIAPVNFSNTPFSNNVVYTGQYNITCTTVASYSIGGDVYVLVSYITNNVFPVTCSNKMSDIVCCITKVQQTAIRNCNNAIGENAKHQLSDISLYVMNGMLKEISGQNAQFEVDYIRKFLSCDCGSASLSQSEFTPINPAVTSIVLNGVGGTSIPSPTTTGNTKTYNIASNVYQVVKGNTGDLAFTIQTDTSVSNTVKYIITFNYDTMAGYILTAITADPTLLAQLNSIVQATGVNLQGLNGACVINLTQNNYSLSQAITGSTLVANIVINGNNYVAPANLFANNPTSVAAWLNGLTLGAFSASVASGILTILSVNNTNVLSTLSFTSPNVTQPFQSTNATLVQVLQAIINYLCNLTALQIALGNALSVCTLDYNNNVVSTNYPSTTTQGAFNAALANAVCNICARINTLTGLTCTKLQAIFNSNPAASFNNASDWYMASVGGNCTQLSGRQQALGFIAAVNAYSDVKTAFCAINCTTPGTCPDISSINTGIVSGTNVGIYGVGFTTTPAASQTVTVRYKLHSNSTYIISTSSLLISPSGNVAGSPPYLITGLTPGSTYDIFITNNCGGVGFVGQVLVPSSTVYSGSFLLSNIIYSICSASPVTLYSNAPFGTGVTMYTDPGASTTPVTGFSYIASGGQIYLINSGSGVVGGNTGNNCSSGTAGAFRLDTSSGTICSAPGITLYTNGGFAIGQIVYRDISLSTPVTGYTFIENISDGVIYNLNSSTGMVISSTGSNCGGSNLVVAFNNTSSGTGNILAITGIPGFALPGSLTPGNDYFGTHSSAFTGAINVQVSNGSAATLCLYKNNVFTHSVNTFGSGTYSFPSDSYLSTDSITVIWSLTGC